MAQNLVKNIASILSLLFYALLPYNEVFVLLSANLVIVKTIF